MSVVPTETVFFVAMRPHGIAALKMKHFQHILARDRQLLNYRFVLTSRQIFVIYDNLHAHQTIDKTRMDRETRDSYLLRCAALTPAIRRGWRPEFRREEAVDLPVGDGGKEEAHEAFWSVPVIHVECEQTAVFDADCTGKTLQLHTVVFPEGAGATYEGRGIMDERDKP